MRRQAQVIARRRRRDAERRTLWQDRLEVAFAAALPVEERLRRIGQALISKGWRIQVKDLTPELRAIADTYIENLGGLDTFSPADEWLPSARRWLRISKNPDTAPSEVSLRRGRNIDDLRVHALNHLAKNFRPATLPHARISISGSDQSDE